MEQTLTKQDVINIVQEQMNKNYTSGSPKVPRHNHDGIDNIKVKESNIIPSVGVLGSIKFARNITYTLYFSNPNPTRIDLNGFAFDTGATNSNALIVGVALPSSSYQFQPDSTHSVRQNGTAYPINGILNQCSSNLYIDSTTLGNVFPHTDSNFIVNAFSSAGNHLVTGQLTNLTPTSVDFIVTNLLSGWNLVANFIIT